MKKNLTARGEEGEAGMDGGLGVAGQSTQEHIIPPIVGVNYTKIHKNPPQLSTKATRKAGGAEKKNTLDLYKHTCRGCRKSKQGREIFGWDEPTTGDSEYEKGGR